MALGLCTTIADSITGITTGDNMRPDLEALQSILLGALIILGVSFGTNLLRLAVICHNHPMRCE